MSEVLNVVTASAGTGAPHPTMMAVLRFLASWEGSERPTLRSIRDGADADLHDTGHVSSTLRRLTALGLVDLDARRPTAAGLALCASVVEVA